jgi:2-polyprenyl-3-methyl-5-hydroxy-6-metoxy-1,4-benzoquinol methylase
MSTTKRPRRAQAVAARALRAAAHSLAPARESSVAALQQVVPASEPEPDAAALHPLAHSVYQRLQRHDQVTEAESRELELVDYLGWETGQKAWACKRWFYRDDEALKRYLEDLRISYWDFAIMHQYALFNRFDPRRPDMYWVYDEIVRRMNQLGSPEKLAVLDFGCGLGQIGLGFALDGYRVVSAEAVPELVGFARYLFESRGLPSDIYQARGDRDYYDSGADEDRYGCVIEWSVFEHIHDAVRCAESITAGLVPGGVFVTTTLAKDWTPELKKHYIRDAGDPEISDQLFSREIEDYVAEHFDVISNPDSIAKLLIKR